MFRVASHGIHGRSNIHYLTFEIYRSENYCYCVHSCIAHYDERIRFNGQTNDSDRCAADRDQGNTSYDTEGGVYKCKGEAWNILMSSNRYICMSLVLQEISYGV